MSQITRRDAMRVVGLAGATGGIGVMAHSKQRERPDHLEIGQIWENPNGERWVVMWKADIMEGTKWTCVVYCPGVIPISTIALMWPRDILSWHYLRSIFDLEGGQ